MKKEHYQVTKLLDVRKRTFFALVFIGIFIWPLSSIRTVLLNRIFGITEKIACR